MPTTKKPARKPATATKKTARKAAAATKKTARKSAAKKVVSDDVAQRLAIRHAARTIRSLNRDLRLMGAGDFQVRELSFSDCRPPCVQRQIQVGNTTITVCEAPGGGPCRNG